MLYFEILRKWKAKSTSKTQRLTLIYTEVNIYSKSWTKFLLLNNSEPAGVSCQPMKLPPHRYPLKNKKKNYLKQQGHSYPWQSKRQPKTRSAQSYCTGFAFLNILRMKHCFLSMAVILATFACQMVFIPEPMVKTLSKSAQRTICLYSWGDWAR